MSSKLSSIKTVIILCISVLSFGRGNCTTFVFPKGESPSLSLAEASLICEVVAKKSKIKVFNPTEARLQGSELPKGGAWSFLQYGRNGEVYRLVVYFPDDLCLILDESHGQAVVSAHHRNGMQKEWPPKNSPDMKLKVGESDVFNEK